MTTTKTAKAEQRPNVHADPLMKQTVMLIHNARLNSYAQLYRKSGVARSTIVKWQRGETRRPQAATLRAVLRVLNYDLAIIKKEGDLR